MQKTKNKNKKNNTSLQNGRNNINIQKIMFLRCTVMKKISDFSTPLLFSGKQTVLQYIQVPTHCYSHTPPTGLQLSLQTNTEKHKREVFQLINK